MSTSMILPEELRFNISEYGQVFNVTPQYIQREVANLDPNFNWAGELMLEYYRANDGVYQLLGNVIESIPRRALHTVGMIRGYPGDNMVLSIRTQSMTELEQTRVMDSSTELDPRSYRGYDSSIRVPMDIEMYGIDLQPAMYLAHPRSSTYIGDGTHLNYQYLPDRIATLTNTYTRGVNYTTPQDLPAKFPQFFDGVPTDEEIIQAILKINPEYDIGSLLDWLEHRVQVCDYVHDNGLDVLSSIVKMTFDDNYLLYSEYILTIYVHKDEAGIIEEYLRRLELEYTINNNSSVTQITISRDDNTSRRTSRNAAEYDIIRSIISDWLSVRMCNINYTPNMNEVYREDI